MNTCSCYEFTTMAEMEFFFRLDKNHYMRTYTMKPAYPWTKKDNVLDIAPHWIKQIKFCPFCGGKIWIEKEAKVHKAGHERE